MRPAEVSSDNPMLKHVRPATGGISARQLRLRALRKWRWDTERLIAWSELSLGLLLAAFYFAAPRPLESTGLLTVTGGAIVLFIAISVIWLIIVQTRLRLLLVPSFRAVLDIAILTLVIWSYQSQYGGSPSASVHAPSFAYYFVFIAVHAMRFDWRIVVFTGLAAALG